APSAGQIDAEMLVKTSVLGRENSLDQMIRKLIEWYRIIMLDAARADFIAVAVEEGHRQLRFLQPIIVRGFSKRRHRQCQHNHESDSAERGAFGHEFVQPAPPTGHMESVHKGRKTFIAFA